MHMRGDKIEVKGDESGTIEAFLRQAELELSPEEAFCNSLFKLINPSPCATILPFKAFIDH
jgi:hypothetical protein